MDATNKVVDWVEATDGVDVMDDEAISKMLEDYMQVMALDQNVINTKYDEILCHMHRAPPPAPATPRLISKRDHPYSAQVSPTDTEFSLGSPAIFDSPRSPFDLSGANISGYAETEASSVDEVDEGPIPTIQTIHSPARIIDPNAEHLVWITSCIQCVVADLPCSRTVPGCSRCIRNGHGDLCLAQRSRLHAEVLNDGYNHDPLLLGRVGDHDDDTWAQKEEMQAEVCGLRFLLDDESLLTRRLAHRYLARQARAELLVPV